MLFVYDTWITGARARSHPPAQANREVLPVAFRAAGPNALGQLFQAARPLLRQTTNDPTRPILGAEATACPGPSLLSGGPPSLAGRRPVGDYRSCPPCP